MQLPYPPLMPDDDESVAGHETCLNYVAWVQDVLDHVLSKPEFEALFHGELRRLAQLAWPGVKEEFERVRQDLQQVDKKKLQKHGLFGPQLRFKLAVVHRWVARFHEGNASLRQLLVRVDDLLKSILDLIGGGGALDEFKKGLEGSTSD